MKIVSAIFDYFKQAKQFRDGLPRKKKEQSRLFMIYLLMFQITQVSISEITGYLAKEKISITNIRILETREDINGVLVISFQTEEDRQRAERCIDIYSSFATSIG